MLRLRLLLTLLLTLLLLFGVVAILRKRLAVCGATGVARGRVRFFSSPNNPNPNSDSDSDSSAAGTVLFHESSQAPFGICLSLAACLATPLAQIITPAVESPSKINTRYRSSRALTRTWRRGSETLASCQNGAEWIRSRCETRPLRVCCAVRLVGIESLSGRLRGPCSLHFPMFSLNQQVPRWKFGPVPEPLPAPAHTHGAHSADGNTTYLPTTPP